MEYIEFKYGSDWYKKSVELRDEILRKPLGLEFTEEFLSLDKDNFHLGIVEGEKLIATLSLAIGNDYLKMRQVAVSSKIQSQGLGSKLVEYSEEFAREKGYKKIVLHARDVAKKFYLKNNYKVIGDVFYEVGIAHFKMQKEL